MPDAAYWPEQIRKTVLQVPGEKCFARKTASHQIATEVREKIRSNLPWVADVLVHVEPHIN